MAIASLSDSYHLTKRSDNRKTGPIPVSTSSSLTCPDACPLKKACYAKQGPLAIHWARVSSGSRGVSFEEFCEAVRCLPDGQLWRHNEAGNLPGTGDAIDTERLRALVEANRGRRGFTYTHKPVLDCPENAKAVSEANRGGFTVNLSADNVTEADQLKAAGIGPVTVVVPEDVRENFTTPAGHRVVICPNVKRPELTCEKCGLCQRSDRRSIVAFPVHGISRRTPENGLRRDVSSRPDPFIVGPAFMLGKAN